MADDTVEAAERREVNPAPEGLRTQVFVVREAVALVVVFAWLLLFAGELLTGLYVLPFWFHCVSVGTLGYALGLNVGELVARPPSKTAVAKRAIRAARD